MTACECEICKNHKPFSMPNGIIDAALSGKLVLFCGSGISTESKNVLPFTFYRSIEEELGLDDHHLPFSELMQMYCDLPDGRRKLLQKIRSRFQYIHSFPELERMATAFHRELAELYFIKTIITTNWDTYFEDYCAATPITIPEDFVFWDESERCVLKIHGSITNLGTVVATDDDYVKCKARLEKGIVGATLKTILANRTVVFMGFSFGDDDFSQILEYLRQEMKDVLPHIYVVTLDERLSDRLGYQNSTCIVTDGTYFLHELKLIMKAREQLVNCGSWPIVKAIYEKVFELHLEVAEVSAHEYPSVVYCLAYQDGVQHAFERFMQMYSSGYYNQPGTLTGLATSYDRLKRQRAEEGNYWDEAYYEGYLNGLILIGSCEDQPPAVRHFPLFYLPDADCSIRSCRAYLRELKRVTAKGGEYHNYAVAVANRLNGSDMLVHHPPY